MVWLSEEGVFRYPQNCLNPILGVHDLIPQISTTDGTCDFPLVRRHFREHGLGLRDEWPVRIGPGPYDAQRSSGNEDSRRLLKRFIRVHPVPAGGSQHHIDRGSVERHRFAGTAECGHLGEIAGQDPAHPIVGLNRDDAVNLAHKLLGHSPGPCSEINDGCCCIRKHPGNRRSGWTRPEPLIG